MSLKCALISIPLTLGELAARTLLFSANFDPGPPFRTSKVDNKPHSLELVNGLTPGSAPQADSHAQVTGYEWNSHLSITHFLCAPARHCDQVMTGIRVQLRN